MNEMKPTGPEHESRPSCISRRHFLRRSSLATAALAGIVAADGGPGSADAAPAKAARESPSTGGLHHILRIFLPAEAAAQRTTEIIDYCRRTGCREVLLFTSSYDQAPSFQAPEEIAAYVAKIQPQAERLRQAGITVDVNVLQTLGHVYFPHAMQQQFPFQRRVFANGHVSAEGACPLGAKLRAWVVAAYATYAQLKPPVLFVDDDYRTMMAGGMSCFCPLHLEQIGSLAGRKVTREEVVAAISSSDWPAPELRRHYYDVTTRGFVDLAEQIRLAVHRVSPHTRIGVMTAMWPTGAQGVDLAKVTRMLAGSHRPLVRPQIPFYSEEFIRDAAPAFLNPARLRGVLPDDVDYWPEIENYQYSLYAKSARCTLAQMAVCVLNGFDHLALNVFDMYDSPLGDSRQLIDLLASRRAFLDRLHELVPCGSRAEGVSMFEHPDQLRVRRVLHGDDLFSSNRVTRPFPALGLPVTFGRVSPWQVLTGDDVLALDDGALGKLLARGALLDARAAMSLALRGQAARIGVQVGEQIPLDDLGYEQFTDPQISPTLHGRHFPLRPLASSDWHRLTPTSAGSRVASEIRNYRRDVVGPALLLTENDRGERFAVLAFSGSGNRHLMENLMRPEQLRNTLAWIGRCPLPLCTHHDAPYLWPILNRTGDQRRVIGLINLATDTYEQLPLLCDRAHLPQRLRTLTCDGRFAVTQFTTTAVDDAVSLLTIRHRLEPLDVAVFVAE